MIVEEITNDPFIAKVDGRWFVLRHIDHCDDEGNWGLSTETLANQDGYDCLAAAHNALTTVH